MIKTLTAETIHFAIADKLKKGASYIEALCDYAKEEDIEIETLASAIKKSEIFKSKLKKEALSLKMIKKDPDERTLFDEGSI